MKKISAFIAALALVFCFGGCTKEAINYNANSAADALNASLTFGETLEKSTSDAAYSIYGIDPALCSDAAIYVGSGATADEIAVFNCIDENAVNTVLEAVNARIEYLIEGYSSYGPDQVPKIEAASVITSAETVIMCICDNPEAINGILGSVK